MAWVQETTNGFIGRYRVDGQVKSTRMFSKSEDADARKRGKGDRDAKEAAKDEAVKQESIGKSSEWIDPKRATATLTEYYAEWKASRQGQTRRTVDTVDERYRSLIAPTFGNIPLRQITRARIETWTGTMPSPRTGKVASSARRRDAAALLVMILDGAVQHERLTRNPARALGTGKVDFKPRAPKSKPHRFLTHEQLRRVVDAMTHDEDRTLVLLAGLTGLRWGEVSALRVADVDLLRGRIKVERAFSGLDDGTVLEGDTKTHTKREVPIPNPIRAMLEDRMAGKKKADLLFSQKSDGAPLKNSSFSRNAFAPAVRIAGGAVTALQGILEFDADAVSGIYDAATVKAVEGFQAVTGLKVTGVCDPDTWAALATFDRARRDGLSQAEKVARTSQLKALARVTIGPGAEDFERLTLHDLRHTAASLAIAGGADVKAVQNMLGHKDATVTLNTYAGLFSSAIDELGKAMGDAYERSAAQHLHSDDQAVAAGVTTLAGRNRRN